MSVSTGFFSGSSQDRGRESTPQDSTNSYDEQATVCAIETFAEHWTEAQAFSVATLAACAITALEASHVDTLPWKHTFLRSLFRQLGIHSREEQEMFLLLQENGSYQDCNPQVLAEPLLPRAYHQQGNSSPQQQIQDSGPEVDIRTEVINDLLYIGLGFEPSTRSRKKVPIQELSHDLAGLDLELPPGYTVKDELYSIGATDYKRESGFRGKNRPSWAPTGESRPPALPRRPEQSYEELDFGARPPALPQRPDQSYEELDFGAPPPALPPRTSIIISDTNASTSGPSLPPRTSVTMSDTNASTSGPPQQKGRVQPLEYDARARSMIFAMCKYLLLPQETFLIIEKSIAQHLYFYQQELIEAERAELEREQRLKEEKRLLELQQQQQQQGTGPGAKVGAFFNSFRGNRSNDSGSNVPISQHGVAMQTQAQTSMQELEKKKKTWKYLATGLSIAAGATVIGLTGGLAAPLVAVGAGVLLGSGAAVLGTTAGIAVMASLFGLAGGGLAGYKMHRRTKDLKVLSFVPILKDPTLPQIPSLHLAIVISGYLFEENDVVDAWRETAEIALDGTEVFHLTFEPEELIALGNAVQVFLATEAVRMVSAQVISQTVFATLASALVLPFGLMRAGDLIDNPWVVAMDRARKSGFVLADILIERVQGNRPTTLIGYSTGAVVIWECLLELAKRQEYGLVNSVVLLGAPIMTDQSEKWKAASSVVSHRFINGYSKKDVVLGSIFRLHSMGLDVAGLQPVQAEPRIENVDLTDIVGGHLEYRENLNMIISLLGSL
ncbi:hypothetical protein BGX31_007272 [Mortierella sp. GBA43]|nr:hypothetical protein BGX31_007272 [Mortierella sp. GBA43]